MNLGRVFRFALVFAAVAGVWLLATGTASAAPSPPFVQCPPVGFDTSCRILIYINDSGAQILTDASQGPYEGDEDSLIGVFNDTTSTSISSIPVTSSSAVFGFDGDGICVTPNPTSGKPGLNCSANTTDTTGYGGPRSYFTNINGAKTAGTVNFTTPLAPGQSTFFSLELDITGASINIISATGVPISAVEGSAFNGQVATLHATDTSAPASQFTASIAWGDGSPASAGSVAGGGGTFTVSGSHTYTEEGTYTATVTITDTSNGNTTTVQDPVTVADAALTAGALTTSTAGVEGVTPTTAAFTFTDANSFATGADFSATCDWGDGTTSSGSVSGGPGSGPYTADCGSHQYTEEGTYAVTVAVTDDGGSSTSASGAASVADALLTSACAALPNSLQSFSGNTATFNDANPSGTLADFTATITWGDGSSSTGTVSGGPGTATYTVSGSHAYLTTGVFTITTAVADDGGSKTTATCSVVVFAFAPGGGAFVIGDGNRGVDTAVTFWGAQWWTRNSLSGGSAPAAFKGFAQNPPVPACGTPWSTAPGNSTPPPAGSLPAYMAVIVASSITQSGSTISGDTMHIVIVKTNAGYAPNPGHAGTGTVVAQLC
jgi:hypothetical protein